MNAALLGTWRSPPLAYVVAEAVISPYYSMHKAIAGLQDALRDQYPRTLETETLAVEDSQPSAHQTWVMISAEGQHGVQIGTRTIALHATSYLHSQDFLSRWAEILDVIGTANLGDVFVERAGLRYIDLIVPAEQRTPKDYFIPALAGVIPEGATVTRSVWEAGILYDACVVNLRVATMTPNGVLLPPQFNPLPLVKPSIMSHAEAKLQKSESVGFVDTDCLRDIKQVFDARDLIVKYSEMQQWTSKTFKAILSPLAQSEWV